MPGCRVIHCYPDPIPSSSRGWSEWELVGALVGSCPFPTVEGSSHPLIQSGPYSALYLLS